MTATSKRFEIQLADPARLTKVVADLSPAETAQLEAQIGGPFDVERVNLMLRAIAGIAGLQILLRDPSLKVLTDRSTGNVALIIDGLGPQGELAIVDIHLQRDRGAAWAAELATATEGN